MSDKMESSSSSEDSTKTLILDSGLPISDSTPVLKTSDDASVPKDNFVANQQDAGATDLEKKVEALLQMPDETTFERSFEMLAISLNNSQDSSGSASFNNEYEPQKLEFQKANSAEKQNSFGNLAATSSGKSAATDGDSFSPESLPIITATTMLPKTLKPVQLKAIHTMDPNNDTQERQLPDMEAACTLWKTFSDEEYINSTIRCEVPFFTMTALLPKELPTVKIANMPPKIRADDLIHDMVANNKDATTLVEIGTHRFDCNAAVLKVYSVWFYLRNWMSKKFVFSESDVPHEAFEFFYEWARCKKPVPADTNLALQLLQATAYLNVDLLQPEVWHVLTDEANCEQKAYDIYVASQKFSLLDDLRQVMLSRINKYFLPFAASEKFLNLKATEVVKLLSLDTIGVNSEMEVFYALLLWLNHKPEKRIKFMQKMMHCVRFGQMPLQFLMKLSQSEDLPRANICFQKNPTLYLFKRDRNNSDVIAKAIFFINLSSRHNTRDDFYQNCLTNKIPLWYARKWIYNPKIPYHVKDLEFPPEHDMTVGQFNDYMTSLAAGYVGDQSVDFKNVVNVEYAGIHKDMFMRPEYTVPRRIKTLELDYVFFKELEEKERLVKQGEKNVE